MRGKNAFTLASVAFAALAIAMPAIFVTACSDALLGAVSRDVENIPPTGVVSINNNAVYSTDPSVILMISASDIGNGKVTEMEVRNDNAFTGNWQTYTMSLPWTLTAGDGTKEVYIRFRDGSGNLSGGYSDTIILDTVNPLVNSISPASDAMNQPRTTNITINFSENVDQSTLTASTVYLRVKNGSTTVATTMSKTANSVTLNPDADLSYGIDYTVYYTTGIKDLAGRSIPSAGSATFTVERDIWEGSSGNETPATAFDLDMQNLRGITGFWFDFVSDQQEEEWLLPKGANSTLARLEGIDYYRFTIPADSLVMRVQLFYTNDETNGTIIDSTPTESLSLSVMSGGAGLVAGTIHSDFTYSKDYDDYDVSGIVGDECLILVHSSNYANRRKYNLRVYIEPGI